MKTSEHSLQVACFNWFKYCYPKLRYCFFAIPNGGHRSITTAKALKAEGVLAGVPDAFLSVAKKGYNGFYIELKTKTSLSDNQKIVIQELKAQNYKVEVVRTVEQFINEVESYLND